MTTITLTGTPPRRTSGPARPTRDRHRESVPTRAAHPAPTSTLRLTRRGQALAVLVLMAVLLAGWTLLGSPTAANRDNHHAAAQTVVVRPGQTLWDIAQDVGPDQDPRSVIADIEDLNAIDDPGALAVGQELFVPTY